MADFEAVTGFEWDPGNALKNAAGHDVSQAEAEQVFLNAPLKVAAVHRPGLAESRYRALGVTTRGRLLTVIFTLRAQGTKIRVISARDMHRTERLEYAR
jgi:uncharacterized protein